MKKITILLVVVLLFLGACSDRNTPKEKHINLTEYTLVRPEKASSNLVTAIKNFQQQMKQYTSVDISLVTDWIKNGNEADDSAKEILVGATNRKQSEQVREKIEGLAFAIEEVGNKIVITGSTETQVMAAMDYFIANYAAKSAGDGTIQITGSLSFLSEPTPSIDLVSKGVCNYKIIRPEKADKTVIELAKKVRNAIIEQTGAEVNIENDWIPNGEEHDSTAKEILIGDTNYSETNQAKLALGFDNYGVNVIGDKIVVCGWNTTTTSLAVDLFVDFLVGYTIQETDGSKGIYIPKNITLLETYGKFFKNIPRFAGGTVSGTYFSGGNNLVIYVTETTEKAYEDYCNLLKSEGFTLYGNHVIGDNRYATYINYDGMVHVYYLDYLKEVRIITSPMSATVLPPKDIDTYRKVTDSKITLLALDASVHDDNGLCIVVTLEDGSYIIVDGGYGEDTATLYQYLAESNKRPDGKIAIAAWIITHAHGDHYYNLKNFVSAYSSKVTLEYIIANDPELVSDFTNTLSSALRSFKGAQLIKPHTGQSISIRNAVIDVLFTHEDLYPNAVGVDTLNNTSTVLRMSIAGQTILITGDAEVTANNSLCRMYKEYLKSDILQVPHHGYPAGTIELYNYVNPSVVLYAVSQTGFDKVKTSDPNAHLLTKLNIREILIADKALERTLVLPYTP